MLKIKLPASMTTKKTGLTLW